MTAHPTAEWVARQVREAFPFDEAPRYLIRDRDGAYGDCFRECLKNMGVEEVLTAPRSPWQNPYVERLIGSIRRECLDHVIVFNEAHLKRVLARYFDYYHHSRTHNALDNNAPFPRVVEPPGRGRVAAVPKSAVYIIATSAWRRPARVHGKAWRHAGHRERLRWARKNASHTPMLPPRWKAISDSASAGETPPAPTNAFAAESGRPTTFSVRTGAKQERYQQPHLSRV